MRQASCKPEPPAVGALAEPLLEMVGESRSARDSGPHVRLVSEAITERSAGARAVNLAKRENGEAR